MNRSPNVIYVGDKLGGGVVTSVGPTGVYIEDEGGYLWGRPLTWERAYALRRGYK